MLVFCNAGKNFINIQAANNWWKEWAKQGFFTVKFLMLLFKQNTCQKGVHFYWKICMHSNGRKEATELLELYLQRCLIFRFYTRANIILFRWAIFEDWHEFCWTLKFKITAINKFPFNFCLKCGCQSKRIIYLSVWDLHQGSKIDYK